MENEFLTLFIAVVAFVFGFLNGFVVMLSLMQSVPEHHLNRNKRRYHAENEKKIKQIDSDIGQELAEDYKEKKRLKRNNGLLSRRLGKERDSWTEFNCSCDDVNEMDYIKEAQNKEENSYQYTKRKSNQ